MSFIKLKQIDNEELLNYVSALISQATGSLYDLIENTGNNYISTTISHDIPTGTNFEWIDYTFGNFQQIPNLNPAVIYQTGYTGVYLPFISGAFTSGCYVGYSSTIIESGLKLNLQVNDVRFSGAF